MIPQALKDAWTRDTVAYFWDGEQFSKAQAGEPREPIDPETGDRYILAEPQRANDAEYSSDASQWFNQKAVVSTTANSIVESETAHVLKGDGTIAPARMKTPAGTFSSNTEAAYLIIEKGSAPTSSIAIWDNSAGEYVSRIDFDWASDSLEIDRGNADKKYYQEVTTNGPNGSRVIQLGVQYSNQTSGNNCQLWVIPEGNANQGNTTIFHHGQIEEAPFPTSPIVTGGSSVTRSNDEVSGLTAPLASGAKSVYFRIEQEAAGYDPNEGGNITNAAINLTTSGNEGSAGNGLLRPSTGVMGVSADGIIDEVINTSDSDLQGNSTTSDVDTFVIKPHKDTTSGGAIYRIYNLDVWEEERTQSEKESLRNGRPQPWLELDGETISALNSDPLWDNNGLNPPPYQWDIAKYDKIPAKIRSAWNRSSSARRFDGSKFVSEGTDVARLDYGPDSNPNGLQVEAAGRTNRVLNSADPTAWGTGGASGVTLSSATSVLDGETAQKVSSNGDSGDFAETNAGTFSSGTETASFILEKSTSSKTKLRVEDDTATSIVAGLDYDWRDDSLTLTSGAVDQSNVRQLQQSGPNGGKLVRVVFSVSGMTSGNSAELKVVPDPTGNGGATIVHHAQLEEAPNASSPIVTGASAVTRAADDYSFSVGDWWNTNEGTVYAEFELRVHHMSLNDTMDVVKAGGAWGRIVGDASPPYDIRMDPFGNTGAITHGDAVSPFTTHKMAGSGIASSGTYRLSLDGTTKENNDGIGYLLDKRTWYFDSKRPILHIKKAIYFPRALSTSTLNAITTPDAPEITLTDANGINLSAYVRA